MNTLVEDLALLHGEESCLVSEQSWLARVRTLPYSQMLILQDQLKAIVTQITTQMQQATWPDAAYLRRAHNSKAVASRQLSLLKIEMRKLEARAPISEGMAFLATARKVLDPMVFHSVLDQRRQDYPCVGREAATS